MTRWSAIILLVVWGGCATGGARQPTVPSAEPNQVGQAFVANMHRKIHRLWGFGVLEDWDQGRPSGDPLNAPNLATKVEIELNADGTISKVTVVSSSGLVAYDGAVIDAVYGAAPFDIPPTQILSYDGRVYVHWSFHRDGRQCNTSGVSLYVLGRLPTSATPASPG